MVFSFSKGNKFNIIRTRTQESITEEAPLTIHDIEVLHFFMC